MQRRSRNGVIWLFACCGGGICETSSYDRTRTRHREGTWSRQILAESGSWQRIREDYGTRQVVFEVKNFSGLGPQEFRQMLSYLTGDYGSLGFIVTRDQSIDVQAGSELEWIREFWARTPRVLVVRLTARWIAKQLSRLRGTCKHDEPERQLGKLLGHVRAPLRRRPGQEKATKTW